MIPTEVRDNIAFWLLVLGALSSVLAAIIKTLLEARDAMKDTRQDILNIKQAISFITESETKRNDDMEEMKKLVSDALSAVKVSESTVKLIVDSNQHLTSRLDGIFDRRKSQ